MIIIGDVHGKIDAYHSILKKNGIENRSLQVGDFGLTKQHEWHLNTLDSSLHKVNFGNHDDYSYLNHPHSCGNYSFNAEYNLFTVRGAKSIDKIYRTENVDWWANEELTYSEFQPIIDEYERLKPDIVVSHDCPFDIRYTLYGYDDKSITVQGLQAMLSIHKPKLWIFGHHHASLKETIRGTTFMCLAELETTVI